MVDPFQVADWSFELELTLDMPYLDQQVDQVAFMVTPKEVEHQQANLPMFTPFP